MEETIETVLANQGPQTIEQLASKFDVKVPTMRARVYKLVKDGKLLNAGPVPNGKKGKNPHTFVVSEQVVTVAPEATEDVSYA